MGTGMAGPAMASSLQQQQQHQQAQAQLQTIQNLQSPAQSSTYGSGVTGANAVRQRLEPTAPPPGDQFPKGLRVLVVDDDICCLKIVENMLRTCGYHVTTCALATKALDLLRANKDNYDLVISDVHMPDMDGFKLLELVGLEMDLPVIMMSANGEIPQVMKGVTHGACDYLIKPVRMLELKNIWQHVVRKKRNESKDAEQSGSLEDGDRHKRGGEDSEYTSSLNDAADGSWKLSKKRKDAKEEDEDNEQDNEDPSTLKKPRVVWSVELHQQFVSAVNKLGIDKAVPKRILELMNVQGLTRENVASHLQKYRLYLKRLSGVAHQQGNPFGSSSDPFGSMSALDSGVGELRALAASGQLTPQALAALQANMLGRMNGNSNGVGMSGLDSSMLLHMGGGNGLLARPRLPQPVLNLQQGMLQGLPNPLELDPLCQTQQMGLGIGQSSMDDVAGLSALQHQLAATGGLGGMGPVASMNGNLSANQSNNSLMLQLLQQQQQQVQAQQLPQSQVGGSVNLQSGSLLSQHLQLTSANEINLGRAGPMSNMTAVNACLGNGLSNLVGPSSRGLGVPIINTGPAMSNSLSGLARPPVMDSKLAAGQRFTNSSLSPSSPAGMLSPSSMKELNGALGNNSDTINCKPVRAIGTNFSALGNLGPGLLTSNCRPSWQSQGPDYGQPLSPIVNNHSPRFGQSNVNGGFVRGQGLMQGMYPGRLSVDTSGAISMSEQSTADSEMKLKDERAVDSIFNTKLDTSMLGNRDDDLLGMFMKQAPQEPLSFSENELEAFPLDNLYVK